MPTLLLAVIVYLDTNVYSAFADELNALEVAVLPEALAGLGVVVGVSPVNLWEICETRDAERRERLIWVAQHVSPMGLLAEVESIVVSHAAEVCGDPRVAGWVQRPTWSTSELAAAWDLTRGDRSRTLQNAGGTEWLQAMKAGHKLMHAVVSRGLGLEGYVDARLRAFGAREGGLSREQGAAALAAALDGEARRIRTSDPDYQDRYEDAAVIFGSSLVVGLTPYPDPVDELWAALGLSSAADRCLYAYGELQKMLWDGPFMALAGILNEQAQERYSPGNWFDAYHLQYLQLLPNMLTLDERLLRIGERQGPESRFATRLHHARPFVRRVVGAVRALG